MASSVPPQKHGASRAALAAVPPFASRNQNQRKRADGRDTSRKPFHCHLLLIAF